MNKTIPIDNILGIKNVGLNTDFEKLGFGIVNDIVRNCKFTPVLIDLTVQARNKWAVVAFGDNAKSTIQKYIACLKKVIIDEKRYILLHPGFKTRREVIISCATHNKGEGEETDAQIAHIELKEDHLISNSNYCLYKYIGDLLLTQNLQPKGNPAENAGELCSLFSKIIQKSITYISIPITQIVKHNTTVTNHERNLIGGAFLLFDGAELDADNDCFQRMCVSIMAVFHKGLINWQDVRNTINNLENWCNVKYGKI